MAWWRVFPWNPAAADGAPFSSRYVPPAGQQTGGRFDVPGLSVLYLAEEPAHALAEVLQAHRGRVLKAGHLLRADPAADAFHPLALVRADLPADVERRLPDLTRPATLKRLGIRPDALATHERAVTQGVARRLHDDPARYPGLRWWSALTGAWHTGVLFLDRVDVGAIAYGPPEAIDVAHPAIAEACAFLRITLP